jgi:hypothetical protein
MKSLSQAQTHNECTSLLIMARLQELGEEMKTKTIEESKFQRSSQERHALVSTPSYISEEFLDI